MKDEKIVALIGLRCISGGILYSIKFAGYSPLSDSWCDPDIFLYITGFILGFYLTFLLILLCLAIVWIVYTLLFD